MSFILFIVIILFLLAIADLIVGVSNDAVNFLNSAIGSKVASFRTIIMIASAGVIIGSFFSSGIMEIARTGIFRPQYFTFDVVMWIFLAVMMTDIVLLDIFNTLGLPTSTTVSIVFELLGASMVAGMLFTIEKGEPVTSIMKYINADSVLTIISGIFLSIVIAFTIGIIVQYLSRLLFTFDYESRLKKYGSIYAGMGITAIIYFLLIKGLKGTTIISPEVGEWITHHTSLILGILFLTGTLLCFLLQFFLSINPLRIVVLMGTFSLAMAFAGNDLVNFIGVPISGFLAFKNWQTTGIPADQLYEEYLASSDVLVPNYMLLIAGFIMAATLWLSAKAKKVTETEVNLGSHHDGEERFQPNKVSRNIVKSSMLLANIFSVIFPKGLIRYYDISFEKSKIREATQIHNKPAFDLVRASANLVIASIIIAAATSFKLPLSTTYVSFMVAMGTSLADKAWGRESAVYRVAGVLSVIGGWFITAIIAFCLSAFFVLILIKGGQIGALILMGVVLFYMVFSHLYFARKIKKEKAEHTRLQMLANSDLDIYSGNKKIVIQNLADVNRYLQKIIEALQKYDEAAITETYNDLLELEQYSFKMRSQTIRYIKGLSKKDIKSAEVLLFSSDLMEDMFSSVIKMGEECLNYIRNLHQRPDDEFLHIVEDLKLKMGAFLQLVSHALAEDRFEKTDLIKMARNDARGFINDQLENRLNRIQTQNPGTRQAVLETTLLLQSRDILAIALRIFNLYRKYVVIK